MSGNSRSRRRPILAAWLVAMAACLWIVAHTDFTADMSAFLPKNPSREQQLLVDQLKDGALSRMLLIGIEGGDAPARAALSRELAARMQKSGRFSAVRNGEAAALARDREILLGHRYLLSPAVTPERFSVAGLRDAIGNSIDLLASPAGMMLKHLLPRDPTGELMELAGALDSGSGPPMLHGAWASRDVQRAILMAQTRARGSDTDAQESALKRIRSEFDGAAKAAGIADARVLISGTPVFATDARATIRNEVTRLSIVSTLAIACLLFLVYRSPLTLGLGLLPVASGALAGVAAVSLGFGGVHGLTIGFGTTLIGEAVDYSIYYFVQSQRADHDEHVWRRDFWPTIRLGVLTSICGFAALLFSGFPGLAQLGLYSISGLVTAAVVTRFVLPGLRPDSLRIHSIAPLGARLATIVAVLGRLRALVAVLALAAAAVVATHAEQLWNPGLSGLSPVPKAAQELDLSLRSELGAPDLRYLVVVTRPEREDALAAAEGVARHLQALSDRGTIAGFETVTRFLPSAATQRARRTALPARDILAARLPEALHDLPLQPGKLGAFLDDVEAARIQPLLGLEDLEGSTLALAVDSMLLHSPAGWSALMPLRAPLDASGVAQPLDAAAIQRELAGSGASFVDILGESNRLYGNYLDEAIALSLAGFAAIVLLLGLALRSPARLARVLMPLMLAVLFVIAGLALFGQRLNLLHLVGLLLIVAVGSNYALFFDRGAASSGDDPHTLASLLLANCTTMLGFGLLAFSQVPVLHAVGVTVGPGAALALLLSATLAGTPAAARKETP